MGGDQGRYDDSPNIMLIDVTTICVDRFLPNQACQLANGRVQLLHMRPAGQQKQSANDQDKIRRISPGLML